LISTTLKYLFVLGAPNDDVGALSLISIERMDAAVKYYLCELQRGISLTIVVTGGHGNHFNCAPRAHRDYANDYLVNRGIPRAILVSEGFLSSNTVEDAILISDFVTQREVLTATVLTSRFHIERSRLIFGCVAPTCQLSFHAADNPVDLAPSIVAHEQTEIATILAQGGVRFGKQFFPLLPEERDEFQ
jgi:hypothetical protein